MEARRLVSWSETLYRVQGRSQGTILSDSDLHNSRANFVNPFYNMEYEILKKIGQNMMWIEAGIPDITLTHSQSLQCTRPSHCPRQQWRNNPIQLHDVTIATQRTSLRARVYGAEIVLNSTDRRSNISLFLHVQGSNHGCLTVFISRVIRLNSFSKMWCILLPRIFKKITTYSVNWKRRWWSQMTAF